MQHIVGSLKWLQQVIVDSSLTDAFLKNENAFLIYIF